MSFQRRRLLGCGIALTMAIGTVAATTSGAAASPVLAADRQDTVLTWYDVTAETVGSAGLPPVTASRTWAIGWIAAGRALKVGKGQNFREAALATAVHDTLGTLVPARAEQLNAELARTLAAIPAGTGKARGVWAGRAAARLTLEQRSGDGLTEEEVSDDDYQAPEPAPGVWQKTPPLDRPVKQPDAGKAEPFLLGEPDRFEPGPGPELGSQRYRRDLAEVRAYGSDTSTVRSAEQTSIARFWSGSSGYLYGEALRTVLDRRNLRPSRAAELIATFHAVTADAQIAVYNAKYSHLRWRPITAIRTGDIEPDPDWSPLITNPQHPEYPGGHSTYAGAAERVLTRFLGPEARRPIRLVNPANGEVRTYTSWSDMTRDNVDGRVWSGIHFRFSDEIGAELGARVADWGLSRTGRLFI